MYCLSCKSQFNPTNIQYQKTNNNRTQAISNCSCGRKCCQFVSQKHKQKGGQIINNFKFENKPLTTSEVNNLLEYIPGFLGTYAKDEIPKLKPGSSVVVNLHESFQPGSHWVCTYIDKSGIIAYFFDSFGLTAPESLMKKMKEVTSNIYYNSITYQARDSNLCGYYCAIFIREMSKADRDGTLSDWEVQKILNKFSHNPLENELFVKKYFS